jgi:chemotaxis-related protein WspB
MLALLFNIGSERFALDAGEIVEVVPMVRLEPPAQPSDFVSGLFSWRGTPVPVLDLARVTGRGVCAELLSTRIILVRRGSETVPERIVGLMAEKVTETTSLNSALVQQSEPTPGSADYGTPVELPGIGRVQRLHLDRLLPVSLVEALVG